MIAQSQSGTGKTAMLSIVSLQLIDTATREVQVGESQRQRQRKRQCEGDREREGETETETETERGRGKARARETETETETATRDMPARQVGGWQQLAAHGGEVAAAGGLLGPSLCILNPERRL